MTADWITHHAVIVWWQPTNSYYVISNQETQLIESVLEDMPGPFKTREDAEAWLSWALTLLS